MRLEDSARQIIRQEVARLFGAGSKIRLFGSRADDRQRGGDIDLLIEPAHEVPNPVMAECTLASRLQIALGGRKVDVLIQDGRLANSPIAHQAREHGVPL